MRILYLSISKIDPEKPGIYSDLINALRDRGHQVTVVLACGSSETAVSLKEEHGIRFLCVPTGELFGVGFLRKGISTLLIEPKFRKAIRTRLGGENYDLVLYATPPITFARVIRYVRKAYGCRSFLMLKDIFPQNAVDIGLFSEKGPIHAFFAAKERELYRLSDGIGCMSEGNRAYLLSHHPKLPEDKVSIFPNTQRVEPLPERNAAPGGKEKDIVTFVFGGNFGRPQAIDFLLRSISGKRVRELPARFLFIGNGGEAQKVKEACRTHENMEFYDYLPPREYEELLAGCDAGLISLDSRFTIPNYPSRVLGYMAAAKPILASTDRVTDIRALVESEAQCGLWCPSDDEEAFADAVGVFCAHPEWRREWGENGRAYFTEHFDVQLSVNMLEDFMKG